MQIDQNVSELTYRMGKLRDEQLAEMAFSTPEDGIREEAITAAKAELDRRGVLASDLEDLASHVASSRAEDSRRPDAPLGLKGILFFLFLGPALVISLGATAILYGRGYKQKSQEALVCILFSFLIYGLIAAAINFLA